MEFDEQPSSQQRCTVVCQQAPLLAIKFNVRPLVVQLAASFQVCNLTKLYSTCFNYVQKASISQQGEAPFCQSRDRVLDKEFTS
jgi:hypothetical protein